MKLVYDEYGKVKQNLIYLANPQKLGLDIISNIEKLDIKESYNNVSETTVSFVAYKYKDGIINSFYDYIEQNRLINVEENGWYQIDTCPETDDTVNPYKKVQAYSLENELVYKRINDINGVFALYDNLNPSQSLLHIIAEESGWTINSVDSSLLNKYRTFQIDSDQIYNLLTGQVSTSFGCIFRFNTANRSIDAILSENDGEVTDIIVSEKNILVQAEKRSFNNRIITKMSVMGADGVDIRAVTPTGQNYIINVDYYKTKISEGGWMSDGLVNSLNNFQSAYNSAQSSYTTLLSSLKTLQTQLTTLKAQLNDLESNKNSQNSVVGSFIKLYTGTPPVGSSDYTLYITALNSYNSYLTQITYKQVEISNKTSQIASVQTQIDNIAISLNIGNFLNESQQKELKTFLAEGDTYTDTTFVKTDTMTEEEIIDMKLELLANAEKELAIASQPQYQYEITANNLLTMMDNPDTVVSYKQLISKCKVGNFITIKLRDDYWATYRIIGLEMDFDNIGDLKITLSNKKRSDSRMAQFAEIQSLAKGASSSFSFAKYGMSQAANITSDVKTFMGSALNAATNAIKTSADQEPLIDNHGIRNRRKLTDGTYSPYQSWWNNETLLFTNDNWISSEGGIGIFTDTTGTKTMSVFAKVIAGELIMSEKLLITNKSGNYSIKDDTGFTATATVGSNTYVAGINPSTPNHILYTSVNGVDKFYIDTVTNQLVLNGTIYSSSGVIGGWTINSNSLTSPSSRIVLGGTGVNLYNSSGNYLGGFASTSSSNNGVLLVKSSAASYIGFGTTTATNPIDTMTVSVNVLYTSDTVTIDGITFGSGFNFRGMNVHIVLGGLDATSDISSSTYLRAGIEVEAPNGSFDNLYVGGVPVFPSSHASVYALSSLEARVSALESA